MAIDERHTIACARRYDPAATCFCGAATADRSEMTLEQRVLRTTALGPAGAQVYAAGGGTVRAPRRGLWARLRAWLVGGAVLCALGGRTAHADRWTAGDTFVEAGVALTLAADYLQTRQICDHARRDAASGGTDWRVESNPIMGPTCNRVSPDVYFPLALAAHVAVARVLPRPLRRVWQGVTIAVQLTAIEKNASAGFAIRF